MEKHLIPMIMMMMTTPTPTPTIFLPLKRSSRVFKDNATAGKATDHRSDL
jgi:hypothetical protein